MPHGEASTNSSMNSSTNSSIRADGVFDPGIRFRVALVSDTHGDLEPRIVKAVERCGLVVHAGDIGSGAVLDTLAHPDRRVTAVRGNNDVASKWDPGEHRRPRRASVGGGALDARRQARGDARTPGHGRRAPARVAARALSRRSRRGVRTHPLAMHRPQRPAVDRQPGGRGTESDFRRSFACGDRCRRLPLASSYRALRARHAAASVTDVACAAARAAATVGSLKPIGTLLRSTVSRCPRPHGRCREPIGRPVASSR